jgi:uncharacterized LabA/DUF88 family protein
VIGYVDGYNLYHGLREAGLRRFYWLDIPAMIRQLLKPDQVLIRTRYFTSRTSFPPATVKRQTTYLEALQTLPDFDLIEGRYDGEPDNCERCGEPFVKHNEKMTDVNIAVAMARDAFGDQFDTAILVTGDADQVPTVRLISELWPGKKRVVCAFPPRRVSSELKRTARGCVHISEAVLRAAQLPEIVTKEGGILLARPTRWTDPTPSSN